MSLFCAHGITAGYGGKNIVNDISFELESGCIMGILGANGCGKTTLLKAICNIIPHKGSCTVDGTVLEKLNPGKLAKLCSYIPQRSGIGIDISVLDVVLMGFNPRLGLLQNPDRKMIETAYAALSKAGLDCKADTNFMHLSEGQKQLCILARTIAADSHLMLLDEPESALDFRFRYRMLEILRSLVKDTGKGIIVSLHDPMLALNMCDKLLLLGNDGKLAGIVFPAADSLDNTERLLCGIYGHIGLTSVIDKNGKQHIVMLNEAQ